MVYTSLACILVATMSPIESIADIKGERFRFHYSQVVLQLRNYVYGIVVSVWCLDRDGVK